MSELPSRVNHHPLTAVQNESEPRRGFGGHFLSDGMPTQTHSQAMTGSTMPREAHRPYRFGMTLLCFGGLLNWVGLFENYTEPVRYIGVTCVVSGAILLCFAICCWLRPGAHRQNAWGQAHPHANPALAGRDPVHFITLERTSSAVAAQSAQKPPDYDSVTDKPPSYDDAIKLSPALLWLANEHERHEEELLAVPPPDTPPGSPPGHASGALLPKSRGQDDELRVSEVDEAPSSPSPPPRRPSRASSSAFAASSSSEASPAAPRASTSSSRTTTRTPTTRTPAPDGTSCSADSEPLARA
ncbi:uncharacterized protein LOC117644445 isoform X2 [Thrips palmi]|uniref:Uncharacterized protein LOC117644445 isoform X2 n=1 Tax=Thrips palmi TaxID=161013 RepID=A0A6P8YS27_THRPL|nr:uncharacterized protein LOC117644445 isoform X2 [Thrips palmi]